MRKAPAIHQAPAKADTDATGPFPDLKFLTAVATIILAMCAVLFFRPYTLSNIYTHDTLIVFDSIHRMWSGQRPHEDFATSLGILTWALPGLVWAWSGQYAGSIETASVLLLGALMVAAVLLLRDRGGRLVAALFLLAMAAMVVVPLTPGDKPQWVSPSMHYNRWGWAVLALVSLAVIERRQSRLGLWTEAVILALLLGFLFYLKITYFAFGVLNVLVLLLLGPERRRVALLSLALAAALILGSGLGSGLLGPYLADLREGLASSGASRNLIVAVVWNFQDILILLAAGFLLHVLAPRPRLKWLLPMLVMLLSGIVIIDQNYHRFFIFSLITFYVLADHILRTSRVSRGLRALPAVLMGVFLSGYALDQLVASLFYVAAANTPHEATIPGFPGLDVGETTTNVFRDAPTGDMYQIARAMRRPPAFQPPLYQGEFAYTVQQGAELLRQVGVAGPILVFDFLDPFSALLDLPRNPNGYAWIHDGRNISEATAPPAADYFEGVAHVMWPIVPRELESRTFLDKVYRTYLRENFAETTRSDLWILLSRK